MSRSSSSSVFLLSGRMRTAAFARAVPNGRRRRVVTMLNTVCALAICATGLSGVSDSIISTYGVTIQTIVNMAVPITLNNIWMIVVLFALTFVPIEARTAVIHVPMFCPKSTYTALESGIMPVEARA